CAREITTDWYFDVW
nr:immunoglobulin heavy chain junction region [Mus musculus]